MNTMNTNTLVARFILMPTLLLIVALFGGVRVDGVTRAFIFLPPPLISLVLASLVMLLFARAGLIKFNEWFDAKLSMIVSTSHALTLLTLFFATAQVFNCVLPERGLLHALFVLFLLWSLINNLFAAFDAKRALRSLAVLLSFSFALKFLVFANITNDAEAGVWRRAMELLLKGVTLGALDLPRFAPATGYIAFVTLALYLVALWMMPAAPFDETKANFNDETNRTELTEVLAAYEQLSPPEQAAAREFIKREKSENLISSSRDSAV